MPFRVALSEEAHAQLCRLSPARKQRVRARIRQLEEDPWRGDVLGLEGFSNRYRVTAGGDRIIFRSGPGRRVVTVLRIGPRRIVYTGYERPRL